MPYYPLSWWMMGGSGNNPFSASASLLGYFYQCLYALLDAVRRLSSGERFSVSIEKLDDVTFAKEGEAAELLQTKFHVNKEANLTDSSPDLWKSLRIWIEGTTSGKILLNPAFSLLPQRGLTRGPLRTT